MRRATIRTEVAEPALVAGAVEPDDTTEMTTRVDDGAVVTTIERETTSGLRSTADDYVVNLRVATQIAQLAERCRHTNHE
jgi:tRNA threonylcarbamoyladenosine modification (KEOPS) complex  Pcc1 subunit